MALRNRDGDLVIWDCHRIRMVYALVFPPLLHALLFGVLLTFVDFYEYGVSPVQSRIVAYLLFGVFLVHTQRTARAVSNSSREHLACCILYTC